MAEEQSSQAEGCPATPAIHNRSSSSHTSDMHVGTDQENAVKTVEREQEIC